MLSFSLQYNKLQTTTSLPRSLIHRVQQF